MKPAAGGGRLTVIDDAEEPAMPARPGSMRLPVVTAAATVAVVVAVVVVVAVTSGPSTVSATATTPVAGTVSVSGTGSVEGAPDTLLATLRVHTRQASVQEALNVAASDAHRVIRSLASHGVGTGDIRTTDLSLDPDYGEHDEIIGYDAGESLNVRIHPLSNVGHVISAASTSAGNAVSIDGLSYDITDDTALLASARQRAFADAKSQAMQYAALSGRSLGRVQSLVATVSGSNQSSSYADGLSGLARAAPVPIRPGRQKVAVRVRVVWSLA
jgi:uncharacterized protein YggE